MDDVRIEATTHRSWENNKPEVNDEAEVFPRIALSMSLSLLVAVSFGQAA